MADHLRRDCLSAYGSLPVRTPNLDTLADESVVFENAYCATPLCTPTRVSMYTGKYPHVHGAVANTLPATVTGPEHETLYERLDKTGYGITHVGVHHCRLSPSVEERVPAGIFESMKDWAEACPVSSERSFTNSFRFPCNAGFDSDGNPQVKMFPAPRRIRNPYPAEEFLDVWWSHRMEERIQETDFSKPQYLEALFWAPHPPLDVPEPYFSMYPPENIVLPETVGQWHEGQPASLLQQTCGQIGSACTRAEYPEVWSAYFGLVTLVDDCIGRVIDALKKRGVWDDCVVVFVQDHGDMLGEHHLFQKHCHYEPASHLPLLVKTPENHSGRRDDFASAIDYCATICDYAGVEPPAGNQGLSWRPAIEGQHSLDREAVFMEYNGDHGSTLFPSRCIVSRLNGNRWKYIYTKNDIDELYDLDADPNETRSLASSADHSAIRNALRSSLQEWMTQTGDAVRVQAAGNG